MTTAEVRQPSSKGIVLGGWLAVAAFAGADVAQQGSKDLGYALVLTAVAATMALWVRARRQGPSLVLSLLLGTLITLAQAVYVLVDVTQDHSPAHALVDGIALAGGLLLVGGTARHFAKR